MGVKSVGMFEAKNKLSELVAAVEKGETVTLTRNGRPVAQLVPVTHDRQKAEDAMAWILSRRWKLDGLTIRELIDDGRRF
jgi:prevent-host-death family protein